jgi:uncharacterized coiled-coil DUF342 family protein
MLSAQRDAVSQYEKTLIKCIADAEGAQSFADSYSAKVHQTEDGIDKQKQNVKDLTKKLNDLTVLAEKKRTQIVELGSVRDQMNKLLLESRDVKVKENACGQVLSNTADILRMRRQKLGECNEQTNLLVVTRDEVLTDRDRCLKDLRFAEDTLGDTKRVNERCVASTKSCSDETNSEIHKENICKGQRDQCFKDRDTASTDYMSCRDRAKDCSCTCECEEL